jgi:hypothetical protein
LRRLRRFTWAPLRVAQSIGELRAARRLRGDENDPEQDPNRQEEEQENGYKEGVEEDAEERFSTRLHRPPGYIFSSALTPVHIPPSPS